MSLVLSLKRGGVFRVGPMTFVIDHIHKGVDFVVRDEQTGKTHDISDKKATEIADDVFVSAGKRQQSSTARITIDAPEEMVVLRGERRKIPENLLYETG
jgi:negative regulator of genetic competence, sporulation and motility